MYMHNYYRSPDPGIIIKQELIDILKLGILLASYPGPARGGGERDTC
jgi:hypothetical protein